ncbi:helix-turn-helix domain-containing protein [Streptomyces tanashiensis]|uniref:helix-turn-helix domain-containing protein n=1 Tax=Streptomyces tanashiensis TaxID=67367 RepID=UPI0036E01E01
MAMHKPHPVVVLSDDILLANRAAVDLLHSIDHALLRELAIEAPREGRQHRRVEPASGQVALARCERVVGSPGSVLFAVKIEQHPRPVIPRRSRPSAVPVVESASLPQAPALVSGEPGTGRTFTVMQLAGDSAAYLAAYADPAFEEPPWLAEAARVLQASRTSVIDDVDLLSPQAAARLGWLMENTTCKIILTGPAVSELDGAHAALASRCLERIDVAPLRTRSEEFPRLVTALLRGLTGGTDRTVTPTVLQILKAHSRPGNMRELRAVLSHSVDQGRSGHITVRDLPTAYQTSVRRRHLSVLEQAAHDAILTVLRATHCNKAQAAAGLGIGRNTLYERIRRLGISF